jgi:hypothetical protein
MLKRLSRILATPEGLIQPQITLEKMLCLDTSFAKGLLPISMRSRSLTSSAGTLMQTCIDAGL